MGEMVFCFLERKTRNTPVVLPPAPRSLLHARTGRGILFVWSDPMMMPKVPLLPAISAAVVICFLSTLIAAD